MGVITVSAPDLVLGNDDLTTIGVIGARNGVLQKANSSHYLTLFDDSKFAILGISEITWITDNLLGFDSFTVTGYPDEFSISIGNDGINGFIEHVGTAIYGTQTGKRLWKLAEPIEWVDIRRFAVSGHRGSIQDNSIIGWACGFGDVADVVYF